MGMRNQRGKALGSCGTSCAGRVRTLWVIGPFSTEAIPGAGLHCSPSVLHLAFPIWLSLLPLGTAWAEGLDVVFLTVGRFAEIFFRPLLRSTSCNQWRRCRERR